MKKLISILYFSIIISGMGAQTFWTPRAYCTGGARYGATSFEINNIGYVCSGADYSNYYDVWSYDPVSDSWSEMAPLPSTEGGFNSASFSIDTFGYYIMGRSMGSPTKEIWRYDPSADEWSPRSDFPGIARAGAATFVVNNTGYLVGGYSNVETTLPDVWKYDAETDTWTELNNFPGIPRYFSFVFTIGGFVFLGGGYSYQDFDISRFKDFWRYDPQTDTWDSIGILPSGKISNAFGFTLDKKGYFVNGTDNDGNYQTAIWEYDPETDEWTEFPEYPDTAKTHGCGFVLNGNAFITTGRISVPDPTASTWEFDNGTEKDTSVIDTTITDTTLLVEIQVEQQLLIYPNPAGTTFSIDLPLNYANDEVELIISSLNEEEIFRCTAPVINLKNINPGKLNSGMFLVTLKHRDFISRGRVVLL